MRTTKAQLIENLAALQADNDVLSGRADAKHTANKKLCQKVSDLKQHICLLQHDLSSAQGYIKRVHEDEEPEERRRRDRRELPKYGQTPGEHRHSDLMGHEERDKTGQWFD